MILMSITLSLLMSNLAYATDHVLLQTGKAFVQGLDDEKAKEIAENREEIKKYSIDEFKIKLGDTIEFRNVDTVKHNVVADEQFNFIQPLGSKDKYKFKTKGTHNVRCAIHPKMKIKVIVD